MMKTSCRVHLVWIIVLSSFIMVTVLSGEETDQQAQSWTYGGIEYVLPRPVDQIVIPMDMPEIYEVVSGDTLWGIAAKYLADPFLWPMIWDLNMDQVPNPHLIFPKQLLQLPVKKVVPEEKPPEKIVQKGPKMFPLVSRSKQIISGYITDVMPSGPRIIGTEDDITELSTSDIVYLNIGAVDGVIPGDVYISFRVEREVFHPETGKKLGYLINNSGLLEIITAQEKTSTAIISQSFAPVNVDDFVEIYTEEPVPLTTGYTKIDRFAAPSGKLPGYIVDALGGALGVTDAHILGSHDIVYVDVGSSSGVIPGDMFIIYKKIEKLRGSDYDRFWFEKAKQADTIPIIIGEVTIFRVKEKSAIGVITQSFKPIYIGSRIELREAF